MIQDKVKAFGLHEAITPLGKREEFDIDEMAHKYVVLVTFYSAFHDISTAEAGEFSEAAHLFNNLGAEVVGVTRESSFAAIEWADQYYSLYPKGETMRMVTDTSANGIVNMLGLPLQDEGYLNPLIAIVDKRGCIRHVSVYSPNIGRSVGETISILEGIVKTDIGGGSVLVPGDWKVGEHTICNTRPGVEAFYGDSSSWGLTAVLESVKSWFSFGRKPKPASPPVSIRSTKEGHAQKPDKVDTPSSHEQTSEQGEGKGTWGLSPALESVKSWFSSGRKPKPVSPPVNIGSTKEGHAQKPDKVGIPSQHEQTSEQGQMKGTWGLTAVLESVKSWFSSNRKPKGILKPVRSPVNIGSHKIDHPHGDAPKSRVSWKDNIVAETELHNTDLQHCAICAKHHAPLKSTVPCGKSSPIAPSSSVNSASTGHSNAHSMKSVPSGNLGNSAPGAPSSVNSASNEHASNPSMDSVPSGNSSSITPSSVNSASTEHSNTASMDSAPSRNSPPIAPSSVKSTGQPTAHSMDSVPSKNSASINPSSVKSASTGHSTTSSTEHTITPSMDSVPSRNSTSISSSSVNSPSTGNSVPSMNSVSTRGTVNLYETKSAAMERAQKEKDKRGKKDLLAFKSGTSNEQPQDSLINMRMAMKAKQRVDPDMISMASATTS